MVDVFLCDVISGLEAKRLIAIIGDKGENKTKISCHSLFNLIGMTQFSRCSEGYILIETKRLLIPICPEERDTVEF